MKGAVPVAAVETNCLAVTFPVKVRLLMGGSACPVANVMMPLLLIEKPVGAGVPVPEAKSRFKLPEGDVVLLPTGWTCQRKCSLTAAAVVPEAFHAEASRSNGCD